MARWCRFLENMYFLENELDNSTKIYQSTMDRLGDQIGNHNLIYLDSNQHFELAIQYYHKAIQLHSEGRTYRIETRKQFFLEDDYNDHLKHFCAAIERYRMNTGAMRKKVDSLREISQEKSILYEYENYFPRG